MNIKKVMGIVVWVVIIGGLIFWYHRYKIEENKKSIEDAKTLKEYRIRRDMIDVNQSSEKYYLLSLKYKLDKKIVYNLINEYHLLAEGLPDDPDFKPEKNKEIVMVSVAIDNLSKRYDISKEVIANILFDEKMLESHQEE